MSLTLKQIILHKIDRQEQKSAEVDTILVPILANKELQSNDDLMQMINTLHQSFNLKAKQFASFEEGSNFAKNLNKYIEQELDFTKFSGYIADLVAKNLTDFNLEVGTLLVCRYSFLSTDYFFLAILQTCDSVLLNEQFEIQPSKYLDLLSLDTAIRINLTTLSEEPNSDRYLSILKTKIGRRTCAFFNHLLEAKDGYDSTKQNKTLVQAVNDYCANMDDKQAIETKHKVLEYCIEQQKQGEDIILANLDETIPSFDDYNFSDFSKNNDYGLDDSFEAKPRSLKALTTFSGSGGGISISFKSDQIGTKIVWDKENDSLTINGLPPNLRDQLTRNLK